MYTYIVFRGNSSSLIENALERRSWWKKIVETPATEATSADMKKILLHRKDESTKEAFEAQTFNFCWKSFSQVKYCYIHKLFEAPRL